MGGLDFAPMRHNSSNVGDVTVGQARHNSSNVWGVATGQVRHNSSNTNISKKNLYCLNRGLKSATKQIHEW